MTDSCSALQKARHLLQHKIGGIIFKLDCHHNLCNVWIKGMELSMSSFLCVIIFDSLQKIPPKHQVMCVYSAIAHAWGQLSQGTRQALCTEVESEQAGHAPLSCGAQGSKHDLCLMAASAIYMNPYVCFNYASYLLRLPKKQDINLLRCLFVLK
jgi:hypothetical protein